MFVESRLRWRMAGGCRERGRAVGVSENNEKMTPNRLVSGLKIAIFAAILVAVLFGALALFSNLSRVILG